MTTEERLQAILDRIAQMKAEGEDMTEALSIMGVNVNGEEE